MGLVDPNSPRIPPPTPEPSAEEAPWIQRDENGRMVECTDENADVPCSELGYMTAQEMSGAKPQPSDRELFARAARTELKGSRSSHRAEKVSRFRGLASRHQMSLDDILRPDGSTASTDGVPTRKR